MALFIIGVQTGTDPVLNHLSAEVTGCGLGNLAFKDQLDAVGTAHIQVIPDGRFKPLAALAGISKDLRSAQFNLPDRQPIAITGLVVGLSQPPGQPRLPFS